MPLGGAITNRSNRSDVVQIVEPTLHTPNLPVREPEPSLVVVIVDALRAELANGPLILPSEISMEAE